MDFGFRANGGVCYFIVGKGCNLRTEGQAGGIGIDSIVLERLVHHNGDSSLHCFKSMKTFSLAQFSFSPISW